MQVALTDPNAEPLRESQRLLNRGQAEQLRLLVGYVESFLREVEVTEPELMGSTRGRATAESAAIMNAAEALGLSEGQVYTQHRQACFARQHLPRVWGAVRAGDVPIRSLVRVISAAERLVSPVHRERLDVQAAVYAVTHRPARLTAWLNRFVARTEPDQHVQRCHRSHAERGVWLEHLEDGVSILHAMLPTLTAEAIKNRLVEVARSPKRDVPYDPCVAKPAPAPAAPAALRAEVHPGGFDWLGLPSEGSDDGSSADWEAPRLVSAEGLPKVAAAAMVEPAAPLSRAAGDPRTQAQREADLFSSWLLNGGADSDIAINAHVGILIEPETLLVDSVRPTDATGAIDATGATHSAGRPAWSRNRRHAYPAEMIRRIILSPEHQITWTPVPRPTALPASPPGAAPTTPPGAAPTTPQGVPRTRIEPSAPPDLPDPPGASPDPLRIALEPLVRVYESRFVPKLLRRAIEFRDGTCQAPGCMVAAEHCDIDHQIPWPHGETTASNLWALCRKHHRLKTAGFLDLPADRPPSASP
ncbi:DUF222 domain-containing protein [Nesterenkonia sp. E16_7]|uniref:HNH endonuclease signature motif containing protein n=1 Tax=unclassified Nesterenkonia TaxID=2629769 RepID=UPI001A92FB31|nr:MULTISPECIES: HNH endonuclease signature motif containing protein [unclassified Nesterenkonia]MBO0596934.1 DUF222 domain-containing protein [Nesterenkonia sp. E16_10]MBO0598112.1 DUF222 domain-containing protein [Nesterenkonia sp. E16_7]